MTTIVILALILLGTAFRNQLPKHIAIWQLFCIGAILMLLLGDISWRKALSAINFEVILYLFGVFVIAQSLKTSGYLQHISKILLQRTNNSSALLAYVIALSGLGSCLLMNDTIAIIGTPLVLQLSTDNQQLRTPLLLALAFAIGIGSVITPMGNPQNLLIATQGPMLAPILTFIQYLLIPSIINLLILYLLIRYCFNSAFSQPISALQNSPPLDPRLIKLSKWGLALLILLIILKISLHLLGLHDHLDFSVIALLSCLPILLFSPKRTEIIRHLDWGSLLFFIGLFVVAQSVWDSGLLQHVLAKWQLPIAHPSAIFAISALGSQIMSNVPLVALYLPLLQHVHASPHSYLALAAGSTLAGNLFIIGAASNIIITHNAEKQGYEGLPIWRFSLLGIPLSLVNLYIIYLFLG